MDSRNVSWIGRQCSKDVSSPKLIPRLWWVKWCPLPPPWYIYILIPETCECSLIWKKTNVIKDLDTMRSSLDYQGGCKSNDKYLIKDTKRRAQMQRDHPWIIKVGVSPMMSILIKDTQRRTQPQRRQCENGVEVQPQAKECHQCQKLEESGPEGVQPCWHLDFRLLVSRTVRE